MTHLLSYEFLAQELAGFKHVGDIVEGAELSVFVLEKGEEEKVSSVRNHKGQTKEGKGGQWLVCLARNLWVQILVPAPLTPQECFTEES